jgi:hypothetical protein
MHEAIVSGKRRREAVIHMKRLIRIENIFLVVFFLALGWSNVFAITPPISMTSVDAAYTQDFDTLASIGTSSAVPNGWYFLESGTNANATYAAGDGSSNTGNTYSFGSLNSPERALGMLQSNSLVPMIGAAFANDTGREVNSIEISYTGEQWRMGAAGRIDWLDFQYSLDQGTWFDVDALDFISPVTGGTIGALDGNSASTLISHNLTGLSVPSGSTFWIRWTDFNVSGADDGLAIDNFSLTMHASSVPEAATVILLGAGLLGLMGARKKL